jgi:hypothetical protein
VTLPASHHRACQAPLSISRSDCQRDIRDQEQFYKQVCITCILQESEALTGKASKADVVVFFFEPLATQHNIFHPLKKPTMLK